MGIEQKNEINYIAQQENLNAYILCAFFVEIPIRMQ